MRPEADVYAYVQDREKHLQLTLFGGGVADPEGAVLLVRGALADGDRDRAAALARQTQQLAMITPGDPDMTAAADHARGLRHIFWKLGITSRVQLARIAAEQDTEDAS
jgi:hypothetical protein